MPSQNTWSLRVVILWTNPIELKYFNDETLLMQKYSNIEEKFHERFQN